MELRVCGMADVKNYQAWWFPTHILTTISPGTKVEYADPSWADPIVKRIDFDDVESPNKFGYEPPKKEQVQEIIDFARTLKDDDRILCHCAAGISRSTAAALIILTIVLGDARKALERLLQVRPQAAPNKLICAYADELLGFRDNRLFKMAYELNDQYIINKGQRTDMEVLADIKAGKP